jgi:D-alanyl-D-alanine dipeptidase
VVKKPVEEGELFSVQAESEKLKSAEFDEMTELSHSKNTQVSKSQMRQNSRLNQRTQ